jgi:Putative transposase
MEFTDFQAELKGPLCAVTQGFSLHAEVYCAPWEREKLEKLCRYIARPAVAEERLSLRPSGDIVLKLKTPYSDGTSHLLFSGLEFVKKLAALVPPPRTHLTRFFGCLAPHAKIRSAIVPKKPEVSEQSATTGVKAEAPDTPKKTRRISWAECLSRVFAIDMKHCPICGSEKLQTHFSDHGHFCDQKNSDPPRVSGGTAGYRACSISTNEFQLRTRCSGAYGATQAKSCSTP